MKRLISVSLVCALLFTSAQFCSVAFATESTLDVAQEKGAPSSPTPLEVDKATIPYPQNEIARFLIRGKSEIEVGSSIGGRIFTSVRPLQTGCADISDFFVVELDEAVIPDEFIASVKEKDVEIYPDIPLDFASSTTPTVESEATPLTLYTLDENLEDAHKTVTGDGVVVALLDNGVDIFHKDLRDHFVNGWDFFHNADNIPATGTSFGEGHGTHVAGTIISVAPTAKIMPLQISEDGIAYVSTVIEAIKYAEDHGAVIANCSWTSEVYSPLLESAMKESSLFFIVAAGNNGMYLDKTPVYPASFDLENVISVAALGENDQLSYFSNYGADVDIAAWGDEVESTLPGNSYGKLSGTSMATAYVSGAAALAVSSGVEVSGLKSRLKESADKLNHMDGFFADGNILNINNLVLGIDGQEVTAPPVVANYAARADRNGKAIDVSAGSGHYNVLMSNGTVWSWGDNSSGQLGTGTRVKQKVPVKTAGSFEPKYMYNEDGEHARLFSGSSNSFLVTPDGEVFGWGQNYAKQIWPLINPDATYVLTPVKSLANSVEEIAVGNNCVLFRQFDNRVLRTGDDLGYKTGTPTKAPPSYLDFKDCVGIAGNIHALHVLTESGDVYIWGKAQNNTDQLGKYTDIYEPMLLASSVTNIAGGGTNAIIRTSDERIYTTQMRRLSSTTSQYLEPIMLKQHEVVQMVCGSGIELYLDDKGQVWATGKNNYGQAGHGTVTDWAYSEMVTPIPGLSNIIKIDASDYGGIALQDDGTVWVWGYNFNGELGNGSSELYSSVPIKVALPKVYGRIASIKKIEPYRPAAGTAAENLALPEVIQIVTTDNYTETVAVTWDIDKYDPTKIGQSQIITGAFLLPDDLLNPLELVPEIEIIIQGEKVSIIQIPAISQEAAQNILLAPTDKTHAFGVPDTISLPETVSVNLDNNTTAELPVKWNTENYDPAQLGLQTISGEVVISEYSDIINPDGILATLEITVLPKEYEVWEATPLEISANIMTGSSLSEVAEQLKKAGKLEINVRAIDLTSEFEVLTYCDVILTAEDNASYEEFKNVPGVYTLTAKLPENFIPLADDLPGPIHITVTSAPVDIAHSETVRMEAPQSVHPKHLSNIPDKVPVVLENGYETFVDVEWNWKEYELSKDIVGEHIVYGKLKNLPVMAQQPTGGEIGATLIVQTIPVNYRVTNVQSDNFFVGDAGLSLEELTAILSPTLTLEISSYDQTQNFSTEYVVDVSFEAEKNPEFNSQYADIYILSGTLNLPENIQCDTESFSEIILQTNAVEVESVESTYAVTIEGTAFEDILGLPEQVTITLSCAGPDGVNKKATSGVDWGTGEGYNPMPTEWNDDGTATMEVVGTLVDFPQYINGAGKQAKLFITVTQAFDLVEISPHRFPETGTLDVKLGSTLEDIYNQLDTHTVLLTLQNSRGETSTVTSTFQLRETENSAYDPLTLGTYTLKGYLPLAAEIRNPNELEIEIVVRTMKYSITNTKAVRVTGVVSGTPFAEVGLPDLAPVALSNGEDEQIPVSWDGSKYNPTKIGSQVVRGTLTTPLPIHLENPNGRQPNAVVTIVDPAVQILSLKELSGMMLATDDSEDNQIPGFEEHRYVAELLYEDGTIVTEIISIFVEVE